MYKNQSNKLIFIILFKLIYFKDKHCLKKIQFNSDVFKVLKDNLQLICLFQNQKAKALI